MNRHRAGIPSQLFTRFLAVISLPLSSPESWQLDAFSKIPPHKVEYSGKGLTIHVKSSASPLVHAFEIVQITGFRVELDISKMLSLRAGQIQGEKGADDFAFRLGFVVPGEKRLTGPKKWFAPEWVRRLYEKVPAGQGIDRIEFFNVVQAPALVGQSRTHPGSDLIRENFVISQEKPGSLVLTQQLKSPLRAGAVWIAADGDDTKSEFDVVIKKIELTTREDQSDK